ncbi:MAG: hypothetical protein QHH10_13460 [Peptococcaceae bacterium]|jgi:hypothetical protein|nr:hypothetical protein [Peptococcaceae bacterium]MDH7526302.1 hypothetical protein [Peptococcaceae bacterium]
MSETLLEELLSLKLKIMDEITARMPERIAKEMKKCEAELIEAICKATSKYLDEKRDENKEKALQSIVVE